MSRELNIEKPVLSKNDRIAEENRKLFETAGMLVLNVISSPGSGKTTLLEALAQKLKDDMAVIVGDLQTDRDAVRVQQHGVRALQIETGGSCHLDAQAVQKAALEMDLQNTPCKILIIENVGNLVCPASYYLGEHWKVALLSLPEGDDKVLKYPSIFRRIGLFLLTKIDLLPYMDFDMEKAEREVASLNEGFETFRLSAKTGEGVDAFCQFLLEKQSALTASSRA